MESGTRGLIFLTMTLLSVTKQFCIQKFSNSILMFCSLHLSRAQIRRCVAWQFTIWDEIESWDLFHDDIILFSNTLFAVRHDAARIFALNQILDISQKSFLLNVSNQQTQNARKYFTKLSHYITSAVNQNKGTFGNFSRLWDERHRCPWLFFQRGGQTDPLEFQKNFSGRGSRGSRG